MSSDAKELIAVFLCIVLLVVVLSVIRLWNSDSHADRPVYNANSVSITIIQSDGRTEVMSFDNCKMILEIDEKK